MGKTILFGPSGFLGPAILKRYPNIVAIGRNKPPFFCKNEFVNLKSLDELNSCQYLKKNNIDHVIFMIGNSNHSVLNRLSLDIALEYNFHQLKKALLFFSKKKIKKFIIFSGALIYDEKRINLPCKENEFIDPFRSNYITSKYLAEQIAASFSDLIPIINVRLSNIYGPSILSRPDLILSIFNKILNNEKVLINSKKPLRDFIHVEDVADATIKLCKSKFTGTVNLGTGIATSVKKICEIIEEITGHKILSKEIKVVGPMHYYHDISLIKKICNWSPKIKIKEGLIKTWNDLKKNKNLEQNFNLKRQKILVTGKDGFLGSCLYKKLKGKGFQVYGSIKFTNNLTKNNEVKKLFKKINPDVVFHCAGKVGGVKFTTDYPAKIFHENMLINSNIFEACKEFKVKKLILVGASCIYPSKKNKNFSEIDIFKGPLHPSVESYGFWKLSQIIAMNAYKNEFDLNSFCAIFPNIYGPGDDFSLENSHVIGALVKKFVDAKRNKQGIVKCWGTGEEIRDCIYIDDAAESLIAVADKEFKFNILNIGDGKGSKIKNIAKLIKENSKFKGIIKWDETKPSGTKKKVLNTMKMKKNLSWSPSFKLSDGIKKTVKWYQKNH